MQKQTCTIGYFHSEIKKRHKYFDNVISVQLNRQMQATKFLHLSGNIFSNLRHCPFFYFCYQNSKSFDLLHT